MLLTIDSFPTYSMSSELSYYVPEISSILVALLGPLDYVSPGSPTVMDHFLEADDLLLNTSSDLPMLPLLPIPDGGNLPLEPVVAPAQDDPIVSPEYSVSASPNMSLEGPFDARECASVSGAAPLVLDNLPGCQYSMTFYDMWTLECGPYLRSPAAPPAVSRVRREQ